MRKRPLSRTCASVAQKLHTFLLAFLLPHNITLRFSSMLLIGHMFAHGMELGRSEHPQNSACTLVACQSVCVLHTFAHGMELGRSEHLPNSACTLVAYQSVCVCCYFDICSPMEWSWEGLNIHQTVHAHLLHVCVLHTFAHGMEGLNIHQTVPLVASVCVCC